MRFTKTFLTASALAAAVALSACNDSRNNNDRVNAYLLSESGRLVGYSLQNSSFFPLTTARISGLNTGETILDIDYRNSEGSLYGLSSQGRIYILNPQSGEATLVSTLVADGTTTPITLTAGVRYTIDFNPVPDRLRVIGDDGSNLRLDALTGETFTDGVVNCSTAEPINPVCSDDALIGGVAYTDTFSASGRGTMLFGIDVTSNSVFSINANAGTLLGSKPLGLPVDFVNGYDIDPVDNMGYAVLTSEGTTALYTINPTGEGNAAQRVGRVPVLGNDRVVGLAIIKQANPTVAAINTTNGIFTFRARQPAQTSSINPITLPLGAVDGETLVALDMRQSDRRLYALSSANSVYRVVSGGGLADFQAELMSDFSPEANYVADFNPTIPAMGAQQNRLRLIGDDAFNAVVNIDLLADNVTKSGDIKPDDAEVVAAAYLNNFRSTTMTRLFVVDRKTASLNVQTVAGGQPTDGQLTPQAPLGITLDPDSAVGFDISGRLNQNQLLLARSQSSGPFTLYRIDTSATRDPLKSVGVLGGAEGPDDVQDIAILF